jgi:hypothetical protein
MTDSRAPKLALEIHRTPNAKYWRKIKFKQLKRKRRKTRGWGSGR